MYYYKFADGKLEHTAITDTKPDGYTCFVGESLADADGCVDWTQTNSDGLTLTAKPVPDQPAPYVPTPEERAAITKQALINAVQNHLDTKARERGYDGIVSVASYKGDIALAAGDPLIEKFITEGNAYYLWRAKVWAFCYAYLDKVKAGTEEVPTEETLLGLLPKLDLGEV